MNNNRYLVNADMWYFMSLSLKQVALPSIILDHYVQIVDFFFGLSLQLTKNAGSITLQGPTDTSVCTWQREKLASFIKTNSGDILLLLLLLAAVVVVVVVVVAAVVTYVSIHERVLLLSAFNENLNMLTSKYEILINADRRAWQA
jgi:hypothetical protein